MKGLPEIQAEVAKGNYRFSAHARRQMSQRQITVGEIEEGIAKGEEVESYPDDKYRPACLVLGLTSRGRPLHILCCEPLPEVVIVTCYEPDPNEWVNFRVRRR